MKVPARNILTFAFVLVGYLPRLFAPTNDPVWEWQAHQRRWGLGMAPPSGWPDIFVWTQRGITDTNLLMSVGFGIISNFAAAVPLPLRAAPPQSVAQLKKCLIGSPSSPAEITFWGTNGCSYHVFRGFVAGFECPDSYFRCEDPARLSRLQGTATITEQQAIDIASNAINRLSRVTDWSANRRPSVIRPGFGAAVPFFLVRWASLAAGQSPAEVEVDGRTAKIVSFHSASSVFYDRAAFLSLESRVFTPEPPKPKIRQSLVEMFHYAQPTTNYVEKAIPSWLSLCGKLGVDPGTQTNLADVDWGNTFLHTNDDLTLALPVCAIRFKNGAAFCSIGGVAYTHVSADACYAGEGEQRTPQERARLRGKIVKYEEDLAAKLELTLIEKVGIPASMLAPLSPALGTERGRAQAEIGRAVGTEGFKRDVLEWRDWPRNAGRTVWKSETKGYFSAEFDLETGELEYISFYDRKLIEAITHVSLPAPTEMQKAASEALLLGLTAPTTNQVRQAIEDWLEFCHQIGMNPGSQTNLSNVQWEQTWLSTNAPPSDPTPRLAVAFGTGDSFVCRGRTVVSVDKHDSFLNRLREDKGRLQSSEGKASKRWQALADELERAIIQNIGIEKDAFAPYRPSLAGATPLELGERGETGVWVVWRRARPSTEASVSPRYQVDGALDVEFDLESGQIKCIDFIDGDLVDAMDRARQRRDLARRAPK